MKKILFVSGSLGLGHVIRDLEIARAIRQHFPEVEISWMAESPASEIIESAGEKLLPEANLLYSSNSELERSASQYKANLIQWVMSVRKGWSKNAEVYSDISESYNFDLWIGDETYDIMIAMNADKSLKKCPFVVIYDFLGLEATTLNPVDHLVAYITNRAWIKFLKSTPPLSEKTIFIGEMEDIPNKKFGFLMPNKRILAKEMFNFVGYVLPEDIKDYRDKGKARRLLGYGDNPLVLCSIGGTGAGKDLLKLCVDSYPLARRQIPDLEMILVCGPRVQVNSFRVPEGVKAVGYLPNLYRHMGAADLCVVSGGGTITLELTALQKPFLYFPLKDHFEQEIGVAERCKRNRAGVRMNFSATNAESLSEAIVSNIARSVNYKTIPINGSKEAARVIQGVLSSQH